MIDLQAKKRKYIKMVKVASPFRWLLSDNLGHHARLDNF